MTITTKYNIGDYVWHAEGAYTIPVQVRIKDIKAEYDEYGALTISYGFGQDFWRITEDRAFDSEEKCQEYVNSKL